MEHKLSSVEKAFLSKSDFKNQHTKIPYITVENFPKLGLITALRFLEWVSINPGGVISLPTGKTPEYFIKWTLFLLSNWNTKKGEKIRKDNGLMMGIKPKLNNLQFVQIDEFYPILSSQHNSFYHYVNKYYIEGFGLNKTKSLLINSEQIPLFEGKHFSEVFPQNTIDLSLRYRETNSHLEKIQQKSISMIDDWCVKYEHQIRDKGGIGFFLGGIGPDGHIAFNIKGSDHFSTTRLTSTNFETQAVAAGDLGGIEISRNRLVITIGLETIAYDPNGVSIIFAAGEAKAQVVKEALERKQSNQYPATVLHKQTNARFYLTIGASNLLDDTVEKYYKEGRWSFEKTEKAIFNLCQKIDKYAHKLTIKDLESDKYCSMIPNLNLNIVQQVIKATISKIETGNQIKSNHTFLHTGPHHDDIMLGIFPNIIRQLRETSNNFFFSILTSGFTAVTNSMIKYYLAKTLELTNAGKIEMMEYPDFFDKGYKLKWDKDVSHYLDKVAANDEFGKTRGICHRLTRCFVEIYNIKSLNEFKNRIEQTIEYFSKSYDGEKNPSDIQKLKGMLREFEEELVWAHYGVQVENIQHKRLGFYTGDIFTQQPDRERDVKPILKMIKNVQPTIISLAFDPEGSGPDTHYKVLQAIAEALRLWSQETDLSKLRIIGYRNVWFKFEPQEANVFTPVSLNSMAVMKNSFKDCYVSQINASFPSYDLDGPFSELAQKTWVEQFKKVQLILGKDHFYENKNPLLRATHGMIFHKEMKLNEFLNHARELEESMEGSI